MMIWALQAVAWLPKWCFCMVWTSVVCGRCDKCHRARREWRKLWRQWWEAGK